MPPDLSVVIVNWRSKDFLRQCLHALSRTCGPLRLQVIVVDGGSFDGCDEMLTREFRDVEFVQSAENIGFGRSNNLGAQRVSSERLLLLNPDTEPRANAVEELMRVMEGHPEIGMVAPMLLNSDGSLQTSCVQAEPTAANQALDCEILHRLFPKARIWGAGEAFEKQEPTVVDAVSGACMLMKTEVFRRVGGFSPEFFMYFEDMDLCRKVRRLGLEIVYVPAAEVVHHGGGSSATQPSEFSVVQMRIAGETYMRLHGGRAAALRYRLLQGVSAVVRLGLLAPVWLWKKLTGRFNDTGSLSKWWAVLRWTSGCSPIRSRGVAERQAGMPG